MDGPLVCKHLMERVPSRLLCDDNALLAHLPTLLRSPQRASARRPQASSMNDGVASSNLSPLTFSRSNPWTAPWCAST